MNNPRSKKLKLPIFKKSFKGTFGRNKNQLLSSNYEKSFDLSRCPQPEPCKEEGSVNAQSFIVKNLQSEHLLHHGALFGDNYKRVLSRQAENS